MRRKVLQDDGATETLQVVDRRQLVDLHIVLARHVRHVHEDRHAVAARRQHRRVVDGTQVARARVAVVLHAVERLRRVGVEHVDAAVERTTSTHALLSAVAGQFYDDGDEERSVLAVRQILHVRV